MSGLHRFARHLAAAADAAAPGASRAPLGIGEVVERLMPYRVCRRALELDSVEDYELLLLRLLAGDERLARAFPPEAAERARAELAGVVPDPSLVRRLRDATILLDPVALSRPTDQSGDRPAAPARIRDYQMAPLESEAEIPVGAAPGPAGEPLPPEVPRERPVAPRVAENSRGNPEEHRAEAAGTPDAPAPEPAPGPEPEAGLRSVSRPASEPEPDPESGPEPEPEPEPSTILADHLELELEVWEDLPPAPSQAAPPDRASELPGEPEPEPLVEPETELVPEGGALERSGEGPDDLDRDDRVHWAPAAGPLARPVSRELADALEAAGLRIDEPGEPGEIPGIAREPVSTPLASGAVVPPPADPPPVPPVRTTSPPHTCPHCAATLPAGRTVRFCPACGRNLVPLRCVRCLSDLEPEWRHCVSCGHPTADSSRFA